MGTFKGGERDIVGPRPSQTRKGGKKGICFNFFVYLISNFNSWMTGHTFAESKLILNLFANIMHISLSKFGS